MDSYKMYLETNTRRSDKDIICAGREGDECQKFSILSHVILILPSKKCENTAYKANNAYKPNSDIKKTP